MDAADIEVAVAFLSEFSESLQLLSRVAPDIASHSDDISRLAASEIGALVDRQQERENEFMRLVEQRSHEVSRVGRVALQERIDGVIEELCQLSKQLSSALHENPMLTQNLAKSQGHRADVAAQVESTRAELMSSGTFKQLAHSISEEYQKAQESGMLVRREAEAASRLNELTDQLRESAEEHESAVARSKEQMMHLRQELLTVRSESAKDTALQLGKIAQETDVRRRQFSERLRKLMQRAEELGEQLDVMNDVSETLSEVLGQKSEELREQISYWTQRRQADAQRMAAQKIQFKERQENAAQEYVDLQQKEADETQDLAERRARRAFETDMFAKIEAARTVRLKYALASILNEWAMAYEQVQPALAEEQRQKKQAARTQKK